MNDMTTKQLNFPNGWDEDFYLFENPDVKVAIAGGLLSSGYAHFMRFGALENRQFRFFSAANAPLDWSDSDYLLANPDLPKPDSKKHSANSFFDHWNRIGRFEGRRRGRDQVVERATSQTSISANVVQEMYMQAQFEPNMFPDDYFSEDVAVTSLDWMTYKGNVLRAFLNELRMADNDGHGQKTHSSKSSTEHYEEVTKNSHYTVGTEELHFTHVFLAPWLKTGGADKAAILFANSVAEQPGNKVLFLTTEVTDSPWAKRLHPSVTYFDLGNYLGRPGKIPVSLAFTEQRELLAAFLLDHAPAKIHVINSHLGWFLFGKYGMALSQNTDLYVSLYCYDYTSESEPVGYARYIRLVAPYLKGIISDNTRFPLELAKNFGISLEACATTWHPAAIGSNIRQFPVDPTSTNVLWASRLDRQKRPDVLLQIANACPELDFHVYGDSVMNDASAATFLKAIQRHHNIHYHGAYQSLNEIKRIPYRAFLYTSQWDGLPNILLEFGLLGLPIVTSSVGGIDDLITPNTGYTVSHHENVPMYVSILRSLATDPEGALARAAALKDLIVERHNETTFVETLASLGYLKSTR